MLDLALDFLLVRKRLTRARAHAPAQRARIEALAGAADARALAARELGSLATAPVRAALLREALVLRATAAGVDALVLVRSALDEPDAMRVREALTSTDRLHFDAMDDDTLAVVTGALRRAERAARKGVEPRSVAQLRATRAWRVALFAVAFAWIAHLGLSALFASPNVALHKDVFVGGKRSNVGEALVDGNTDRHLSPVVVAGANASFTVDLAAVYVVDRVRVFNRRDADLDACLPLALETSIDGQTWTLHERQHDHFLVWDESMKKTVARYVRLRAEGHELGLLEIEVYGRYGK